MSIHFFISEVVSLGQKLFLQVVNRYCASSFLDKRPAVDKDVLLGTASVDLSLLTTGFRQIHGWYNLVDFAGQQNGQIKVDELLIASKCNKSIPLSSLCS